MEFDWLNGSEGLSEVTPREVEEAFEDPFSIRLLPDIEDESSTEARYFILGKSITGRSIFTLFWTDGKRYRVICARPMTDGEIGFYDRKNSDLSN
jgi:uncharacterized DUF497 family protein